MSFVPIKDGEFTSAIYGMIKEHRYADVIRVLQYELQRTPNSRAAMSLLAYCYYNTQDNLMAAEYYGKLTDLFPQYSDYKLHHAQSLYNAFMFPEAVAALALIDDPKLTPQVMKLDSAIKYREEDLANARILVEQYEPDDPDTEVNLACLDFKADGNYEKALERFTSATKVHGYQSDLAYSLALCHYQMGDYDQALKYISEIVDRGVKDYPVEAAAEALTDMPPRAEEELDPVTLHNQAIINVDTNLSDSFAKLQYLLGQNPFPPETFANLLLLYCRFEYYDLAADVLAENAHLTYKYLTQYMYDYLDALITQQSSTADAYNKFDAIANDQLNQVRKSYQHLQEIRGEESPKSIQKAIEKHEECMERYVPVLMAQAKIIWSEEQYEQVEALFKRSAPFCQENDIWLLNFAHTLFMQEKFKDSAQFYAPIVNKNFERMLDISAIVLANLCVCYIMTNSNEEAEEVMKKVEKSEKQLVDKKSFHLCIINLVIGTLYCSKGNYEFGISRIVSALDPIEKKLGMDTWYHSKRCMASMLESVAKNVIIIRDEVLHECLRFLEACEVHGRDVPTETDGPLMHAQIGDIRKTISYEARLLRSILLRIFGY
ncbi:Tetratricopeptide repeat protein 30 [Aphelenchoides avenae]|nr:Tetratricopeptide repeat protein 30 [Aphelenchus avenae]